MIYNNIIVWLPVIWYHFYIPQAEVLLFKYTMDTIQRPSRTINNGYHMRDCHWLQGCPNNKVNQAAGKNTKDNSAHKI